MHVAVGGVRMNAAAGFKHFDITVHGVQVFDRVNTCDAQCAVHGGEMLEMREMRNVHGVFHGNFDALILGIPRGDGDSIQSGVHLDGDAVKVRFPLFGCFYRVNFDLIAVPTLHLDGAVDILQFKRAPRLQRIRLVEILADGISGKAPNGGQEQHTERSRAEGMTEHIVLPPSRMCYQREPRTRTKSAGTERSEEHTSELQSPYDL